VLQEVRESVASLPKRAQPKIIGKNAARLYQLS
jgi:predicted TIM-barrel fold metal-dependent hydrolase